MKNWRVFKRNYNNSYFETPKGQAHYSDYSSIMCIGEGNTIVTQNGCTMNIRSKANYVDCLPDATNEELL
ncbi:MAG: hypothetical protein COA78_12025 [Blastopirellula sp.]|nr:MAG: hypothetical protein COA78_12025 [Blastopirellula sp.]